MSMDTKLRVVNHWHDVHRDKVNPPKYIYEVVTTRRSAIERQLKEALHIEWESQKGVSLFNSKVELATPN